MKQIRIADRTLCRTDRSFSFKERLEIARRLEQLRLDVIELPEITNERVDVLLVKTMASFIKSSVISVAVGTSAQSVELAKAALKNAAKPRIRVELPVSPATMEYQYHKKPPKMLEWIAEVVSSAASVIGDVEFCALDAGNAEVDFLKSAIKTAVDSGAKLVTVCDDSARILPDEFSRFIDEVTVNVDVPVGVMCSDKFDCACAASLICAKANAELIKCDVDGGIAPLEKFASLIFALGENFGICAGARYTELHRTIKQIRWICDSSKADPSTLSLGSASEEGSLRLDVSDDINAVKAAIAKLGYDLSDDDIMIVYEEFKRVAEKKNVGAKELDAIVASTAMQVPAAYKLVSYVINSGNVIAASAQITLEKNGKQMHGVCLGDGPVDAAFLAIEQIIGHHYELDDFQINSVTEGKDSVGNAVVKLRSEGKLYSGSGISTDIIGASIRAFLNAVNRIAYEEE